jgi:hypothetical protein
VVPGSSDQQKEEFMLSTTQMRRNAINITDHDGYVAATALTLAIAAIEDLPERVQEAKGLELLLTAIVPDELDRIQLLVDATTELSRAAATTERVCPEGSLVMSRSIITTRVNHLRCDCGREIRPYDLEADDGMVRLICAACHRDLLQIEWEVSHENHI